MDQEIMKNACGGWFAKLSLAADQIGLSPDERASERDNLIKQVDAVFSRRVAEHAATIEQLTSSIAEQKRATSLLASQLQRGEEGLSDSIDRPLRTQLSTWTHRHEALMKIRTERLADINGALKTLQNMWHQLGSEYDDGYDQVGDNVTEAYLTTIKAKTNTASALMVERRKEVLTRVGELRQLHTELGMQEPGAPSIELDKKVAECKQPMDLGLSMRVINELCVRRDELEEMKRERGNRLKKLAMTLSELWSLFEVNETDRNRFLSQHVTLSLATFTATEAEIASLQERKRAAIKELVSAQKAQITRLWDETRAGTQDRDAFVPFYSDEPNDELLSVLKTEANRLIRRAAAMKPLLQMVEKRDEYLNEVAEYEKTLSDPNRFKIPGRMLKEEKVRKLMSKTLPSLEKKLRSEVVMFERENGPFSLDGVSYIERMDDEKELARRNEEDKKAERKDKKAAQIVTPSTPSKGRAATISSMSNMMPLVSPRHSTSSTTPRHGNTTAPSTPRGHTGTTTGGRTTGASLTPRATRAGDTFITQSEKRTPNKYATLPASYNANQKRGRDENASASSQNQSQNGSSSTAEGKAGGKQQQQQMGPSTGDAHSLVKRARVVQTQQTSQTLRAPLSVGRVTSSSGSTSGIKPPTSAAAMLLSKTGSRIPTRSSATGVAAKQARGEGEEGVRRLNFNDA